MPDYRSAQPNDGFDDFDDFDDFDNAPTDESFDDFDDFDNEYEAPTSFSDDFDDAPAPMKQPAYNEPPYRQRMAEQEEFEPGPAKPPKEHKARRVILSLLAFVLIIAGIGVTAHFDSGFMPMDVLSWKIGGATVGDLFKVGSAEQLMDSYTATEDDKVQTVSETDESIPDSVKYADFDIYEGNTYCTIKGYNGTELEIALPATYNGKPCTHIEANAFSNSPVTAIEIPDSYTYIGQTAFSGCSITDLYLPDSVTEIGWGMCSGNKDLQSVRISASLETIPEWAFANCVSLTDLEVPGNIKTVGQWAFTDCTSITKLTLREGIVTLDNCAFYGCTALSVVVLPNSVTTVGEMCFRSCTSLMIVAVPETLESIGKNAFMNCSQVLTFFGEVGGKWETYAKKNDIDFQSIANLDLSEDEETTETTEEEVSASDVSSSDAQ